MIQYPLHKNRGYLSSLALLHWEEYLPKKFEELVDSKSLQAALNSAVESTLNEMHSLMQAGMTEYEAWAAVREKYLLLKPEDTEEDEPENELYDLFQETMDLRESALRHLDEMDN